MTLQVGDSPANGTADNKSVCRLRPLRGLRCNPRLRHASCGAQGRAGTSGSATSGTLCEMARFVVRTSLVGAETKVVLARFSMQNAETTG